MQNVLPKGGHMDGSQPIIRGAVPADVDALLPLLRDLFSIEEDFVFQADQQRRGLVMLLAVKNAQVLVAETDGHIIGMCTGQLTISTAEGGPSMLVEDVVVRQDARRRGTGRRLLDAIVRWGEQQGASRMQLLADRHNTPALRFYERLGWKTTNLICLKKQ